MVRVRRPDSSIDIPGRTFHFFENVQKRKDKREVTEHFAATKVKKVAKKVPSYGYRAIAGSETLHVTTVGEKAGDPA